MKKKKFLVVGIGVLGRAMALELSKNGVEVIAIDSKLSCVDPIRDRVSIAAECDATDVNALKQLGAATVDVAIVCIGEEFEAAVLATAHLLDLNVPHVAARANSDVAESILKRLGAHEVFFVEGTIGKMVADRLVHPNVLTDLQIGDDYRMIQWHATGGLVGKSLTSIELPKRYGIQVMAIRCPETKNTSMPDPAVPIKSGDRLFLLGKEADLDRFIGELESGKS
ncbi:MAG: hypothetical protein COT74_03335 [Bdellovibrionales bacterium CG10_big_fil_rev_8_21_14_0_10_45_34]|nr:MAG: hypothetical protein COT74_03335 [Bdellovibrionales bacterium CG10_big_fil_rev_8_21_14_0_10_45_34]